LESGLEVKFRLSQLLDRATERRTLLSFMFFPRGADLRSDKAWATELLPSCSKCCSTEGVCCGADQYAGFG